MMCWLNSQRIVVILEMNTLCCWTTNATASSLTSSLSNFNEPMLKWCLWADVTVRCFHQKLVFVCILPFTKSPTYLRWLITCCCTCQYAFHCSRHRCGVLWSSILISSDGAMGVLERWGWGLDRKSLERFWSKYRQGGHGRLRKYKVIEFTSLATPCHDFLKNNSLGWGPAYQ